MTIAVETAHNGDADTETAAAVARDRRQPRRWPRPAKHGRRLPRHPDHRDGNELTGEAPRSTPCALRPPIGEQRTFRRLDLAQRHWLGWGSGSARCSEPRYQITGDNCRSCLSAGQSFDVRHDGGWWDLLPESRSPWRPVSVREPFDALLEHAPPETHAAADGGFDAELECCVLTGCDWFRKFDPAHTPSEVVVRVVRTEPNLGRRFPGVSVPALRMVTETSCSSPRTIVDGVLRDERCVTGVGW
jgi:hypothetical protein